MKKITLLGISLLLIMLTGCTKEEEPVVKEVNELSKKFDYTQGVCLRDKAKVVYTTFARGDEIEIIDEDQDFYYINYQDLKLFVDKRFVRLSSEGDFESYNGYSKSGVLIFSDPDLENNIGTLTLNQQVEVLDSFAGVTFVKLEDGTEGYVVNEMISKTPFTVYVPKVVVPEEEYYSGGGGGGGSSAPSEPQTDLGGGGGSGDSQEPSVSLYVNNIYTLLAAENTDYVNISYTLLASEKTGKVLVDNTKVYIAMFDRGEEVSVIEFDEAKLVVDGRFGTIDPDYIEEAGYNYANWNGFTKGGTPVYSDYDFENLIQTCSINTQVEIIDEVKDRYIVKLDNGQEGYVLKDYIITNRVNIAPIINPEPEPVYEEHSGGGGGSSAPAEVEETGRTL